MSDGYVGEIRAFGFGIIPKGWLCCDGKFYNLAKKEYLQLGVLLGSKFGGDDRTRFAVPDLRGAIPVGYGKGKTSNWHFAKLRGEDEKKFNCSHTHAITSAKLMASSKDANQKSPAGSTLAYAERDIYIYSKPNSEMAESRVKISGKETDSFGESSVSNIQPSLVVTYCICYDGEYPKRAETTQNEESE